MPIDKTAAITLHALGVCRETANKNIGAMDRPCNLGDQIAGGFEDKGISGTPQRLECSSMRQIDIWLLLPSVKTANVYNKPAGLIGVGSRR